MGLKEGIGYMALGSRHWATSPGGPDCSEAVPRSAAAAERNGAPGSGREGAPPPSY